MNGPKKARNRSSWAQSPQRQWRASDLRMRRRRPTRHPKPGRSRDRPRETMWGLAYPAVRRQFGRSAARSYEVCTGGQGSAPSQTPTTDGGRGGAEGFELPRDRPPAKSRNRHFTAPQEISPLKAQISSEPRRCRRSRLRPGPDQPVLRHGDTIALTRPPGYLQAEGHLDLRVWVRDARRRATRGLRLEVLPALQHEARRALGAALDAGRGGAHVRERGGRRPRSGERVDGARGGGQPALYGQAVELRHVRGGKLSPRERALAPLEPNCLRVELDEEGGAGCWLRCCRASRSVGGRARPHRRRAPPPRRRHPADAPAPP